MAITHRHALLACIAAVIYGNGLTVVSNRAQCTIHVIRLLLKMLVGLSVTLGIYTFADITSNSNSG